MVLIVEDDVWLAECYQRWLRLAGHASQHVTSAQAALDTLEETQPDVIVLDMMLPMGNGLQLLHQLQSYTDVQDIPVVVCSNAVGDSAQALQAYGVAVVLDKARLTPQSFVATIHKVCRYAQTHAG